MKSSIKLLLLLLFAIATRQSASAQATAAFTAIVPNPACNPAVVSFVDGSSGVAPLSYQWNFGVYGGVNSVFQNPSTSYLTCGTYTVQLIVTDATGAKDTTVQTITIYCSPTPLLSVTSSTGCTPLDVTYYDNSTPGDGTIQNITWDFGDGYLGSGDSMMHTYTEAGCNTVTQIVTNTYGCQADTTINALVCVSDPPVAAFTSDVTTACAAPLNVAFNAQVTGGSGPFSYQWDFQNATPSTDTTTNPTATFNSTGNSNVQLTVTDANGCSSTVTQNNYISIANNTVDFTLNSLQACAPATFTANGIATGTPQSWSWTTSDGQSANTQNPTFNILSPGTYDICLTVQFSGGCSAQRCSTVVVHDLPTANFSISGNAPTCIRPSQLTFTNSSSGDTLSYNWSFPGGSPASYNDSTPPAITYNNCGVFNASLAVTDVHGCVATVIQNNMFVITCPQAHLHPNVHNGCVPLTVTFSSDSSTGNPVQYDWDFGDGTTGSGASPSHTYANNGCYTVSLITTTAEGCKDTVTVNNAVCAGTQPQVSFTSNPPVACANAQITFTSTSTNVFSYTTYQWNFVHVPPYTTMSTLMNPTYVYEDTGWFNVTLIASNYGCSDTLTIDSMEHILPPVAVPHVTHSCATPLVVTLSGTQSLGADTYTWVIPSGNPSTASTPTVSVTYTASGNYSASLFVTNNTTGCTDQASINIPVRHLQTQFTGNPLSGCATLNACMTNQSIDAVSYAWRVTNNSTGATIATSTQTNPCFALSLPGVYDVRLITTDMFGCKDTLLKPAYITVWGPVGGFYGTPLQGCTPLTVNFTDTSATPTSSITNWTWNFGDPTSGAANTSSQQNPTHVYNTPGFYTVTLTVTDNHGCSKTIVKTNYVHAIHPHADFILSDTTLCEGQIACFTNASSGSGLTYQWTFGNGNASTLAAPCQTYDSTGNYNIQLIVTDSYGCKDTIVKPNYVNVSHPQAGFVADTTHSSCPPLAVHFTNTSVGGVTYKWTFGDGSVSNAQTPTHIYNQAGTFTVTLIVTNANGCKDTLKYTNYIAIGGPQASVATPVTSGCNPFTACFAANSPASISFVWNFGDGTVTSDDDSICYTYTRPGTFYPELILNDGVGCNYALPIGVIHVGGSYAYFKVLHDTICGPSAVAFMDSSWSYVGVGTHSWNFGDPTSGAQNTSNQVNPTHYFATPGTYTVTLNLATPDTCNSIATKTIYVAPLPHAQLAMSDSMACAPATIQFTDLSTSTSTIVQYNWSFGDSSLSNTSSLQNPSHIYSSQGLYTVTLTVTDSMGCSSSAALPLLLYPPTIVNAGPDVNICIGSSSQLYASGGSVYQWSPASGLSATNIPNPIASPSVTTTYVLAALSVYGCSGSDTLVVYVNVLPQVDSLLATADTCSAGSAQVLAFASNGTSPYQYLWSNGFTNDSLQNVFGGVAYTVTVTDANGCTASTSVNVSQLGPATIGFTATASTCGQPDGAVNTTVTGGAAPYDFMWSNGATTQNINGLSAGIYAVTVFDANGCSSVSACTVNDLSAPTVNAYATNATCGSANGSIAVQVSGQSPFAYNWNNGSTAQNLVNLNAGNYSATVTDANGCSSVVNSIIINHNGPSLTEIHTNATCGQSNGSIDVTTSGGTQPIQYAWNTNFSFNEDLSGVAAGTYLLIATDSNQCSANITVIITDTPTPQAVITAANAACGLSNGSMNATASGGATPYNFIWSTGATTSNLSNLAAGTYTLTFTDANGCSTTATGTLSNTSGPTLALAAVNTSCGQNNGNVTATVTGGVAPFTYQWSNGTSTQNLNNVGAGNYAITVTSANGCLAVSNAIIASSSGVVLTSTSTPATCGAANGAVSLQVSGGTLPYTFHWSNNVSTQNLVNTIPGTYAVTVTDANNCSGTLSSIIGNNTAASPTVTYTVTNTTCNSPSGAISLTVSSGVGPYSFAWSNGKTTLNITNLTAGNYTVTVTGANGCKTVLTAAVGYTNTLTLNINSGTSQCSHATGTVNAVVSGTGTAPFTYHWSNTAANVSHQNGLAPGVYYLTVTDVNGCSAAQSAVVGQVGGGVPVAAFGTSGVPCQNQGVFTFTSTSNSTLDSIHWLIGGSTYNGTPVNYTFSNSGSFGVTQIVYYGICTDTLSQTVSVYPLPTISGATTNVNCAQNGSISLTVTSGALPYTFQWNTNASTQNLNNVPAGTYNVTVTDAHGCSVTNGYNVGTMGSLNVTSTVTPSTCGINNGSITVNATGGTTPYHFAWNNGATTQNLSALAPATYNLTVTDATLCSYQFSMTVAGNPSPVLAVTHNDAACGQANGSIDLTATSNTTLSYAWTNGATTQDVTNISAGTYNVTVNDNNGCSALASVAVNNLGGPLVNTSAQPATCNSSNGHATATVIIGFSPYSYHWSSGVTTQTANGLSQGTYNVTVTDANGCQTSDSVNVTNIAGPSLMHASVNTTCGNANGQINETVTGGAAPYAYNWNNGLYNVPLLTNLAAGTYAVVVTDQNNCQAFDTVIITNTAGLDSIVLSQTAADCGHNNGSASVNAFGGTMPYTFAWSNGATADSITSLFGNHTYFVTVTDANGCTISGNVPVQDNAAPQIAYTTVLASCGLHNGAVDMTLSGGLQPYTYNWNNGQYNTEDLNNLPAGTYSLIATDARGCMDTASVAIDSIYGPYISYTTTPITCNSANGAIDVTVLGGTAPFQYNWNSGMFAGQDLSNLTPGTYSMQLTDANNCHDSVTVQVAAIPVPTLGINAQAATCGFANGDASVNVQGSTGPYTYQWNDTSASNDSFATNLSGNQLYNVSVIDSNGCVIVDSVFVNSIAGPVITLNTFGYTCDSTSNGSIAAIVTSGAQPFIYNWNAGQFTTQQINNLAAGTYTLVVTDSFGCQAIALQNISSAPLPQPNIQTGDANCGSNNGFVSLSFGSGSYNIIWSNGATDSLVTNLAIGTYNVTVTNANGCSIAQTVDIVGSDSLHVQTSSTPANCGQSNGSAAAVVTGGTLPYVYNWSNGATDSVITNIVSGVYTVQITDANGCSSLRNINVANLNGPSLAYTVANTTCGQNNGAIDVTVTNAATPFNLFWSTGDTSQNLLNVASGIYNLTLTDVNGCNANLSVTVGASANNINIAPNITPAGCGVANGAVALSVTNGQTPYSFAWNNGDTLQNVNNLSAGAYFVTITDSLGCSTSGAFNVQNTLGPEITLLPINATCSQANGSVYLDISGYYTAYDIQWSNGATDQNLLAVAAGNYTVTVTDSVGCQAMTVTTVYTTLAPTLAFSVVQPSCGQNNGSILATATGDSSSHSFNWNNGAYNTSSITNLASGTYQLVVTNGSGCTASDSATLINVSAMTAAIGVTHPTCGNANGTVDLTVLGGTAPYVYDWNSGQFTTEDLTNLSAGVYSVSIIDANNCSVSASATLLNIGAPSVSATVTGAACGQANGNITLAINGGVTPYNVQWSNGATDQIITNLPSGTYDVTVTDAHNCSTTFDTVLQNTSSLTLAYVTTSSSCSDNNGAADVTVTSGTAPYNFVWSNGSTVEDLANIFGGNYFLTVTDASDCSTVENIIVNSVAPPQVSTAVTNATCGIANGSATASVISPIPYSVIWSDGTPQLMNADTGSYQVIVTDSLGCVTIDTVQIFSTPAPVVSYTNTQPSCGINNGGITLSSSGGAYSYQWSSGETTPSLQNIGQGIYDVIVTDNAGCSAETWITLNASNGPQLVVNASSDSVCSQQSVTLQASGALNYTWSPSQYLNQSTGASVVATVSTSTTFTVSGTDANGCMASQQIIITVHPNPTAVIAPSAAICQGNTATLAVNGNDTYAWSGDNTIQFINGQTVTVQPIATTTYFVNAVNQWSCASQDSAVVVVNATPQLVVNVSNPHLCSGEQSNITVNGGSNYQWTPNTGLAFLNDSTVVAAPSQSITYTVSSTNAAGCSDTVQFDLWVFPSPILNVTPPNPVICLNSSTVMTASGAANYFWSPATGLSTTTGTQVNASPGANSTYTITGVNADGCTATTTATITIGNNLTLSLTPSAPSVCYGSTTSLQMLGADSYTWQPNVTFVDSVGSIVLVSPSATTTYTVTGTDVAGCSGVDTVVVNVLPLPIVTANNATICFGLTATLHASGAGYYQWYPNTALNTNFADTVFATPTSTITYTVYGTTLQGCMDTAHVVVTVIPAASASFTGLLQTYCSGAAPVTLTGQPSGGVFSGAGMNGNIFNPAMAGNGAHQIVYTFGNGTACASSDTQSVQVFASPVVTVDTVSVCVGNSVSVTAYGATTYNWNTAATVINTNNNIIALQPAATSLLTVIGTSLQGCSDTTQTVITVDTVPTLAFMGLDSTHCYNTSNDTLLGTPVGGTFSGNGIVSGNIFNPQLAGAGTHVITYTYTTPLGCSASVSHQTVVYNAVNLSVNATSTSICYGTSGSLSASGCSSYSWSPAVSLSVSSGSNVAATPSQTTTYTVIGTDVNACTISDSIMITVGNGLNIVINTPQPTLCLGSTASVTASGANNYTWSPSTGLNATTGSTVNANPIITTTYTVTGTTASGCSGSDTLVITVNPLPIITATHDTSLCNGGSMTLTANGAYAYTWIPSTSLSASTGANVTANPSTNTTYTVIGTNANGCSNSTTVALDILPTSTITTTNASACIGSSAMITANGAALYSWSPSIGLNNNTTSTVTANPLTTTTYTVVGIGANGCTSSATSVFTVNPLPTAHINNVVGNTCLYSQPVSLSGTPNGGVFSGNGVSGNVFNPSVAGVGSHAIVYTYTNANGCSATDTTTITVHAQPNVIANNATVCSGTPANLSASGASAYAWAPATGLNSTTGTQVTSLVSSSILYTITGTDAYGCTATTTSNVQVGTLPQLTVNNASVSFCQGAQAVLIAGGASSYQWAPSMGLSSSSSNTVTANPTVSTTYTLIGSNAMGCSDTLQIPVNVMSLPITIAGPDAAICSGNATQLNATSNGSVVWTPGAALSNTNTLNPIASPTQTTTYTVTATSANGCTASDSLVVIVSSQVNLTIVGGGTVCAGNAAQLQAYGSNDYHWQPSTYLNTDTGAHVICTPLQSITYTVTANNSLGCPSTDSVTFDVKQPVHVVANGGSRICPGELYQLSAQGDGNGYEWMPHDGLDNPYVPSPYASPTVTTTYTVTTTDNVCFTAQDTAVVVVYPLLEINTSGNVTIVAGAGQQLFANSNGMTYAWSPSDGLSCTDCSNPFANPTQPTTYTVTVTDSSGCRKDADIVIDFACSDEGIYIPNTFTPNGDGKNDVFRIRGNGVKAIKVFRVFSRWGELMFETSNMSEGWDGTYKGQPMSPAVFDYYVEGICTNGQAIVKQGNVTLMR